MQDRDETLERVYGRARQLWWRRRVAPVGAVAIVLVGLLAVPVLGRDGGNDGREVAAIDEPATTTVAETTSTSTVVEEVTTTSTSGPTEGGTGPTTTRPRSAITTTTTPTLVCRNSFDERCGPFRWEPAPGPNAAMTVTVSHSPAAPRVGQEVTFTVVARDADALINFECSMYFGEGPRPFGCDAVGCRPRYGPWDTPAKDAGDRTFTYRHTFDAAGTYSTSFSYNSGTGVQDYCGNPYTSEGHATEDVVVSS